MSQRKVQSVTGAFGNLGGYIAGRLLAEGRVVETLTNSPGRDSPLHDRIQAHPLSFRDPGAMDKALANTDVLYNTYWVRFNTANFTFAAAVENSKKLFEAARRAGVSRVVHVSITNPSLNSPFEYFRGKAQVEAALEATGIPYSILRPAMLYGPDDILINNIAWILRHLPVFGLFGNGRYHVQPIFVEDMATLALQEGQATGNRIINAVGPEDFEYRDFVGLIARTIGLRRFLMPTPPLVGWLAGQLMGFLLKDDIVRWEEIGGLMADLLHVPGEATGTTRLSEWLAAHGTHLGKIYCSELQRRRDREIHYGYSVR